MTEFDHVPELYTEREIEKARRRGRWLGRVEGAAGLLAAGFIWNAVGWIPTLLVVGIAGYVLYRLLAKPKGDDG